jgi:hypothetical protein
MKEKFLLFSDLSNNISQVMKKYSTAINPSLLMQEDFIFLPTYF